jgi:hypothetical protein
MQQSPLVDGPLSPVSPDHPTIPVARRQRTWYIVLIFCFFAAIIPETIATTSTSVAKIAAHIPDLFFVMAFYGPADLLIREALIRRRLGWGSLVLLGIAFGFVNEGVVAGTWYTNRYAGYAYLGQIDYAWAVALTVFHIFISVIMPIAFVEELFPSWAGKSLLRRRGMVLSAIVFLLVTSLVAFVPAYRGYRVAVFALALVLAFIAIRLPAAPPRQLSHKQPPRLWQVRLAGFFASVAYFAAIYVVPQITLRLAGARIVAAQFADMIVVVLFATLLLAVGRRWTGRAGWSPRHTLALIAGALSFSILIFLLPPLWPTLEPLVTLPFVALVIGLDLRLRQRERTALSVVADHPALPIEVTPR